MIIPITRKASIILKMLKDERDSRGATLIDLMYQAHSWMQAHAIA